MSLQTFLSTVKTDIETWVDDVEDFTEAEASKDWALVKPVLAAFVSGRIAAEVRDVMQRVITSLPTITDLAQLESAVLNAVESELPASLADLQALGSELLQAILGLMRAA